jgi:hypothetical protein
MDIQVLQTDKSPAGEDVVILRDNDTHTIKVMKGEEVVFEGKDNKANGPELIMAYRTARDDSSSTTPSPKRSSTRKKGGK